MKIFILFLFLLPCLCAQTWRQYYDYIAKWEGVSPIPYDDGGTQRIGVGHQLRHPELWADKNGNIYWTEKDIEIAFYMDWQIAMDTAKKFYPNFDTLPEPIRFILVDLSFNLGETRLREFKKFSNAILHKQFGLAAKELKNSKWYGQVGLRAQHHVKILEEIKWQ